MTVFVDDAAIFPPPGGWAGVSALWAESTAELVEFGRSVGLGEGLLVDRGGPLERFDVTAPKRAQAVRAGATPVTAAQRGEWVATRAAEPGWPVCLPAATPTGYRSGAHPPRVPI